MPIAELRSTLRPHSCMIVGLYALGMPSLWLLIRTASSLMEFQLLKVPFLLKLAP